MRRVAGTEVDLAGNGRCDSPGHSAKYCTYSLLCIQINRILHYEQIRVGEVRAHGHAHNLLTCYKRACYEQAEKLLSCYKHFFFDCKSTTVPNSVAMEKEGLARSMEKLEEQGVAVRSLTTGNILNASL